MRFAIAALVFTAAAAQNNFVGQSGSKWFQGAGSWSLSRVPRFPDDVTVNGKSVTFVHAEEPGMMEVTAAPEPNDIIWGNLHLTREARKLRVVNDRPLSLHECNGRFESVQCRA